MLKRQLDGLEAGVSHFKRCEQTFKSSLRTVSEEKSRIIEQLEEQLLPNVKETLNLSQDNERDKQSTSQVQKMEKVIEVIRKSLRETENDLHQTKDALTVKTERTEFLERRVEETEMLLEETRKRLSQNQYNLEQTAAALRQQLEKSATIENQLVLRSAKC